MVLTDEAHNEYVFTERDDFGTRDTVPVESRGREEREEREGREEGERREEEGEREEMTKERKQCN